MKRTKIVCTIGPASDSEKVLRQLLENGMNVARFNFSHNVHSYHLRVLKRLRQVSRKSGRPVAILQDLQGPRIRLGDLPKEGIKLVNGKTVTLATKKSLAKEEIPVTYANMHRDVKVDERVLIADGLMELVVKKVIGQNILCRVVNGGVAYSHKGINLPDTKVTVPAISEKDKEDLLFGVKNGVDFVALSFVRCAKDVSDLRRLISQYEKKLKIKSQSPIKVVVKIERIEAINNIDEIIAATDAVMIARGDLGIELPPEEVPLMQKMIIDKCLKAIKPVIVATQMLESMINNPRPTRAEVSDVANAVIDHTDAVMLSGETASGKFPVEAVKLMNDIIARTESSPRDDLSLRMKDQKYKSNDEAMSSVAKLLSLEMDIRAIAGVTHSGHTGRVISRYRPELPIYMGCLDERILRQLCLSWGVTPFRIAECRNMTDLSKKIKDYLKKQRVVKTSDKIIIISGVPLRAESKINLIEVQEI